MQDDPSQNSNPGPDKNKPQAQRIRLPGFILEKDVGLGDIIKHATSALGIKPCGECQQRASALNNWIVFGPGKRK
jgi:hypothetical protein